MSVTLGVSKYNVIPVPPDQYHSLVELEVERGELTARIQSIEKAMLDVKLTATSMLGLPGTPTLSEDLKYFVVQQ